jgi:hypothetical protein
MLEPQDEYMLAKRWREHGDPDAAHKLQMARSFEWIAAICAMWCGSEHASVHGSIHVQLFATAVLSSAARRPLASFKASSFAQNCMKNGHGCSVSMWFCSAVTPAQMPCSGAL